MANASLEEMQTEKQQEFEMFITSTCPHVSCTNLFMEFFKLASTQKIEVVHRTVEKLRRRYLDGRVMTPLVNTHVIEIYGYMMTNEAVKTAVDLFDSFFERLMSWLCGHQIDNFLFQCTQYDSVKFIKNENIYTFFVSLCNFMGAVNNIISTASINDDEDFCFSFCNSSVKTLTLLQALKESALSWLCRVNIPLYIPNYNCKAFSYRLSLMEHIMQTMNIILAIMYDEPSKTLVNELFQVIKNGIEITKVIQSHNDDYESEYKSTYIYFEMLQRRIFTACVILHLRDFERILNYFHEFSYLAENCLLSRSIAQVLFLCNRNKLFGVLPMNTFFYESISHYTLSPVMTLKYSMHNPSKWDVYLHNFINILSQSGIFFQFIRIAGYHIKKQRKKLAFLISSIANLQADALELDIEVIKSPALPKNLNEVQLNSQLIGNTYFLQWVRTYGLRAMYMYLTLGFETNVYHEDEYLSVYWYLYEFVLEGQEFLLNLVHTNHLNKQGNEENAEEDNKEMSEITPMLYKLWIRLPDAEYFKNQLVMIKVLRRLSCGLYMGLSGFIKAGRLNKPQNDYDCFEKIHTVFLPLSSYKSDEYLIKKRDAILDIPLIDIYKMASEEFKAAYTDLKNSDVQEKEIWLIIATKNMITMNILASGHQQNDKTPIKFDYTYHQYYPVILIQ